MDPYKYLFEAFPGLGDGGPATEAFLLNVQGLAVDEDDNLYIAHHDRATSFVHHVRKVGADGIITTVTGTGEPDDGVGDNLPPAEGRLTAPIGIAVDGRIGPDTEGLGLLIADSRQHRVRQVTVTPSLIGVVKSVTQPVNLDEHAVYTLEVTNHGLAGTATGVRLTDEFHAALDFVSARATQGSCSEADGTVTCELGQLGEGDTATVELTVVPNEAGVVVDNTAVVTANEEDPFPHNHTDRTVTAVGGPGCGHVVTQDITLNRDVGPCPHNGIIVGADDITVDLNGHQVFGFRHFDAALIDEHDFLGTGDEAGMRITDQTGVTVTNGSVTGFSGGVRIHGGGGHTLQDLHLHDNRGADPPLSHIPGPLAYPPLGDGVFIYDSSDNRIVDNEVVGSAHFTGIFVGGFDAHRNLVQGNLVEDTSARGRYLGSGQGIVVNSGGLAGITDWWHGTLIFDNDVKQNIVRGNASAGITNVNNAEAEIMGNRTEGNGISGWAGNGVGVSTGGISRFDPQDPLDLTIRGNEIHNNDRAGIELGGWLGARSAPKGVRVLNNNVTGSGWYDLVDFSKDWSTDEYNCDGNVWRNNLWSDSGYFPECTTEGGRGPFVRAGATPEEDETDPRDQAWTFPRRSAPSEDELDLWFGES